MFIWAVKCHRSHESHGQLFGTTRGGAEVDVCHHFPLGNNWLACFSFLRMHVRVSLTETFGCRNGPIESLILATISHIFPENPLINLCRCYSAHPVSILRLTSFEKLFQSALKSRSMDHTIKHRTKKIKSYSQAFNLQKRLKIAWEIVKWRQNRCKQKRIW